jgi:hypothetical protein
MHFLSPIWHVQLVCSTHDAYRRMHALQSNDRGCKHEQASVSHAGEMQATRSLWFFLAAFVLLLLLLSKMALNLKSLIKDDHWMQRVELFMDRLGRAGVPMQDGIVDIMNDASMSNYAMSHGLTPGTGYGVPGYPLAAKVAAAPPGSLATDDTLEAIGAGANDNTVDAFAARRSGTEIAQPHL